MSSQHSASKEEVRHIPLSVLVCPYMTKIDERRVLSLMDAIKKEETNSVPPIDVLRVKGSNDSAPHYTLGGIHRYAAYVRLQRQTVPVRIIECTAKGLDSYMCVGTEKH